MSIICVIHFVQNEPKDWRTCWPKHFRLPWTSLADGRYSHKLYDHDVPCLPSPVVTMLASRYFRTCKWIHIAIGLAYICCSDTNEPEINEKDEDLFVPGTQRTRNVPDRFYQQNALNDEDAAITRRAGVRLPPIERRIDRPNIVVTNEKEEQFEPSNAATGYNNNNNNNKRPRQLTSSEWDETIIASSTHNSHPPIVCYTRHLQSTCYTTL